MPSFQLFLSISASKPISTPIRDLNPWPLAIPVQCSINWANEPTGSWSLLVYKWSINECEYMKIIYIWLRNEYESHIRSDGHRNKSFFWSLAKTGKKIKCVNVPWFMSYRVKHSKRNSISTRSIYLDRRFLVYAGLPYIESVSEVLGRCLQQQGVRTVFKSDKTVRSHFDHSANRDPIMLAKRDGAVYKISPLQLPLSRRNSNEFFFTKTPINCGRL